MAGQGHGQGHQHRVHPGRPRGAEETVHGPRVGHLPRGGPGQHGRVMGHRGAQTADFGPAQVQGPAPAGGQTRAAGGHGLGRRDLG